MTYKNAYNCVLCGYGPIKTTVCARCVKNSQSTFTSQYVSNSSPPKGRPTLVVATCFDCHKDIYSPTAIYQYQASGIKYDLCKRCYDFHVGVAPGQTPKGPRTSAPHIHWSTKPNPNTWMPGGQPSLRIHCKGCGAVIPWNKSELCNSCFSSSPHASYRSQQMPRQGQTGVRIWWDKDVQAYYISTPYNQNFVEFIKAAIPVGKRHWDPQTKIWMFSEEFLPPLLKLCQKVWGAGNVTVIDKFQVEKASATPSVQKTKMEDVLADFIRLLPYDVALTAYRKAAMQLHPDRGGDETKMSKLNTLWKRIQKELYQQ